MAEDSAGQDSNEELIAGLEEGDIKPNFYEGGFKTWECALDLARLVASEDVFGDSPEGRHIIEVCAILVWIAFVVISDCGTSSSVQGLQFRPLRSLRSCF